MGTNFYLTKKNPHFSKEMDGFLARVKKELHNKVDECFDASRYDCYNDMVFDFEHYVKELRNGSGVCKAHESIHLGKRSYGWQFLWDLNEDKYYKPTLASIKEFIASKLSDGWVLNDEYGNEFTLEQFLDVEIGYCLYYVKDKYRRGDPEHELISDRLRFARFTDFS